MGQRRSLNRLTDMASSVPCSVCIEPNDRKLVPIAKGVGPIGLGYFLHPPVGPTYDDEGGLFQVIGRFEGVSRILDHSVRYGAYHG